MTKPATAFENEVMGAMTHDDVMELIRLELQNAERKFPRFNSGHEGKAVIEEELDELWVEIKGNRGSLTDAMIEAIQTAAMAARYLVSLGTDRQADYLLDKFRTREQIATVPVPRPDDAVAGS